MAWADIMKKLIMFWILVMFLPVIQAQTLQDIVDSALIVWHPSINVSINNGSLDQRLGEIGGAPSFETSVKKLGEASGFFDNDDSITFNNTDGFYDSVLNQTVSFWSNYTGGTTAVDMVFAVFQDNTAGEHFRIFFDDRFGTDVITCTYIDEDEGAVGATVSPSLPSFYSDNTFNLVTCVVEGTGVDTRVTLYINDTIVENATQTILLNGTTHARSIGYRQLTDTEYYDGGLDQFMYFNKSLTGAEVSLLWNGGNGTDLTLPPPVLNDPEIQIIRPVNNTLFNEEPLSVQYAITLDSANVTEIRIAINGTLNKTVASHINTTVVIGAGTYNMSVEVDDTNGNTGQAFIDSFKIDFELPLDDLLTVLPSGTKFGEDVNITVTASDDNLFGHNVTVIDNESNIVFSQENINISGQSNQITIPIDISSFGLGTFTVNTSQSDDHTDKRIRDYEITKDFTNKRMTFETGSASVIVQLDKVQGITGGKRVDIKNTLNDITDIKREDRYEFGFTFNDASHTTYSYKMKLITDKKLYYIKDSKYSGHFVVGDNWIDFEPHTAIVEQVSEKEYDITVVTNSNEVEFKSIGGVNIGSSVTTFEIVAPSVNAQLCDLGSGFVACSTADATNTLEQVQSNCTFSNSALFSFSINGTDNFTDETGIRSGDLFTFNNSDVPLTGASYNLTTVCFNDLTNTSAIASFTTTAQAVVTETEAFQNRFFAAIVAIAGVMLVIVALVGVAIAVMRGFGKRGGTR